MNGDLENKLVAACRDGDCSAYASLVKSYSGRIFAVCYGILGNTHDAEDVAQQTLLRGFANIRQIRRNESFGAWISRIARNLCVDFLRRQKRRRSLRAGEVTSDRQSSQEHPELRKALAELSEEHRLALMLYYFDGCSTKAVAEAFEISEGAAQARLSRARRQLRKLLQAKGYF
ncbi:MAG: RNA polymerase sigma factor [Phycisphaerales bacterium]|nr:MAG: RNA polymerase sigma factor [Phycisphaerales bacterium]